MSPTSSPLPPRQTFLLLVVSMLITAIGLRLYLHLVKVQHVYPGGYLVHHLFTGILVTVPAAFILAFGTRLRWLSFAVRIALGIGTGLMLDEVTYLVMTGAGDNDYVSFTSFAGAAVLLAVATGLGFGLCRWHLSKSE